MFLAQNTDIVISHQLENPLNYFYLEVRWQGYPLVHNAHLCADLGYYYRDNDVEEGRVGLSKRQIATTRIRRGIAEAAHGDRPLPAR
ncbi:DUF2827 family protein [Paraburkholderia sp. CI3]|uniref:DUF2827 family protein n=1 Tax=Paraburkholderia sp. CI3 TaxID=2991060 RepID=UPI003D1E3C32